MKRVKGIVLVGILFVIALGIILAINHKQNVVVFEKGDSELFTMETFERDLTIQLSTPADSEEEAKEIAHMYGITYVDYYRGCGYYETEKSFDDLKAYGQENNFPDLEILYKSYTK